MSHHTNLRDADQLILEFQAKLATSLDALVGPGAARKVRGVAAENALRELIAHTRANFELERCCRNLAGILGEVGRGPTVRSILIELQEKASEPEPRPSTPLPLGVATPVPNDGPPTKPREKPVVAHEAYAADVAPTQTLKPKHTVVGPWDDEPKPRGKR